MDSYFYIHYEPKTSNFVSQWKGCYHVISFRNSVDTMRNDAAYKVNLYKKKICFPFISEMTVYNNETYASLF